MDLEHYKKRVADQYAYCLDVIASDRTHERKGELLESAFGVIARLIKECPEVTVFTALVGVNYAVQLRMILIRPKPSFEPGGVVHCETKPDML
jgi:hypothetical protein